METLVKSPRWQEIMTERGWLDLYQPADQFGPFLADQQSQVKAALEKIGLVK